MNSIVRVHDAEFCLRPLKCAIIFQISLKIRKDGKEKSTERKEISFSSAGVTIALSVFRSRSATAIS
ncbi:conserved hypothetical protein [Trichinella spiralis]|uniref:hypothetical protein n=1 Tax=Trichinella spiralis TaxID=6334 RepID=UPI0001EFB4DB|nr:conserved hypothetical protein [Trichinella spiralis]